MFPVTTPEPYCDTLQVEKATGDRVKQKPRRFDSSAAATG